MSGPHGKTLLLVHELQQRLPMRSRHPVQFLVEPAPMRRVQVAVRLALLIALATVGRPSIYWMVYLALPVIATLLISRGGADAYLDGDAPRIVRVLRWVAGAYAYLWILTDAAPSAEPSGPVELSVRISGRPTLGSAILRLITGLPAVLLVVLLSIAAAFFWVFGAIAILATERVPAGISDFIAMKIRYQFRVLAYLLSLVDAYPSLPERPLLHAPHTGAT
jgi:hypothetical protein